VQFIGLAESRRKKFALTGIGREFGIDHLASV